MFRKPKRSAKKAGLRARKPKTDDEDEDGETTREVQEALKRAKNEHSNSVSGGGGRIQRASGGAAGASDSDGEGEGNNSTHQKNKTGVMHHFEAKTNETISQKDLATSTTQHHPKEMEKISKSASQSDPKRNKFLAGPIRAPTNIRTTCRFDYQPDICKDYKDTGFCGFGDTCIYLHDRGDTMSGWQLEKAWEEKQQVKKREQEKQMERFMNKVDAMDTNNGDNDDEDSAAVAASDDGIPFACFLCRKAFDDPIVTTCGHYFCQGCLQDHYQNQKQEQNEAGGDRDAKGQSCPICGRDTHGVMNQPTKLIGKKRKLLGRKATWQEFLESRGGAKGGDADDNE